MLLVERAEATVAQVGSLALIDDTLADADAVLVTSLKASLKTKLLVLSGDLGVVCSVGCSDTSLLSGNLGLLAVGQHGISTEGNSAHARKQDDGAEHRDGDHVLRHVARVGVGQQHAGQGDEQGSTEEREHGSDAELECLAVLGDDRVDAREGTGHEGSEDEGGERVGDDRGGNSRNHVRLQSDSLGECRGGCGEDGEGDDAQSSEGLTGIVPRKDQSDAEGGKAHEGQNRSVDHVEAEEGVSGGAVDRDGVLVADDAGGDGVEDDEDGNDVEDAHGVLRGGGGADLGHDGLLGGVDGVVDGVGVEGEEGKDVLRHDGLRGWDLAKVQESPHSSPYG